MTKLIKDTNLDEISSDEVFFVDTNVLFAVHFEFTNWEEDKITTYASFILDLLENENKLCVSALNLQELYHLIEKVEYRHYEKHYALEHRAAPKLSFKDYRHIPSERERLAKDLKSKHLEISKQYTIIPSSVNEKMIGSFVSDYQAHSYDPIDYFTVNHNELRCTNFITDDSDFKHDSNITVYTYA